MMHAIRTIALFQEHFYLLYLDPGNGSLILQLILGALLAIGLTVRIFWSRIKGWFAHKPPEAAQSVGDDPAAKKIDDIK